MKKLVALFFAVLSILTVSAQMPEEAFKPVKWSLELKMKDSKNGVIMLRADIQKGWHLYGTVMPEDGPMATEIKFALSKGLTLAGVLHPSVAPVKINDPMFGVELNWWDKPVTFTAPVTVDTSKVTGALTVTATVSYMACNDVTCAPPTTDKIVVIVNEPKK